MPGIDAQLLFSDAQALTGTTAVVSTNVIDLGADRNIGIGEPITVSGIIDVSLAGAATEAITVTLETDDNVAFTSAVTVAGTGSLTEAQFAAGQIWALAVPVNLTTERFIRLSYIMTGTTPTATVTSWLGPVSMAPAAIAHYADNILIS